MCRDLGAVRLELRNERVDIRSIYNNSSDLIHIERGLIALSRHLYDWKPTCVSQRHFVEGIWIVEREIDQRKPGPHHMF